MATFAMITTVDTPGSDVDGNPITIPTGTVINVIAWDGGTPYEPPAGTRLDINTGLDIGQMV